MTQICDFYMALLKDVDDLPKELRGLIYKCCKSHFTTKCLVIWAEKIEFGEMEDKDAIVAFYQKQLAEAKQEVMALEQRLEAIKNDEPAIFQ